VGKQNSTLEFPTISKNNMADVRLYNRFILIEKYMSQWFLELLSKNLMIKVLEIKILPVVLYGSETWSLTLREERRLSVFENRVFRRVFDPKRDEVTGGGENYIMSNLMI
jgi:hypothetical protein